jgi:predicted transcriptional regulator
VDPGHESTVVLDILDTALRDKCGPDVTFGMYLAFHLGLSAAVAETLTKLLDEDWHRAHEDIASALDKLRYAGAVDALHRAALHRYAYRFAG